MSEPILPQPPSARRRVQAWLQSCPGMFKGRTEREALEAARAAFGESVNLNRFDDALRSLGFRCDASRREYDSTGAPTAHWVVTLRLPEKPKGA